MDNFNNKSREKLQALYKYQQKQLQLGENTQNYSRLLGNCKGRYVCSERACLTDGISSDNERKCRQGNATQFLLMLSEFDKSQLQRQKQSPRYKKIYVQQQLCDVDVTPWTSHQQDTKLKQINNHSNSKTNLILSLPRRQYIHYQQNSPDITSNKVNINRRDKDKNKTQQNKNEGVQQQAVFKKKRKYKKSKEEGHNKQNILSKLQIVMIKKNQNMENKKVCKSSHSAVARYSQNYGQNYRDLKLVLQHNNMTNQVHNGEENYKSSHNNYKINGNDEHMHMQKINCKSIVDFYNQSKPLSKYQFSKSKSICKSNKQNELDAYVMPKLQQYCSRSSTTHTQQKKHLKTQTCSQKQSTTKPTNLNSSSQAYICATNMQRKNCTAPALTNPIVVRKNTTILSMPITKFIGDLNMYTAKQQERQRQQERQKQKEKQQSIISKKQVIEKLNENYREIKRSEEQTSMHADVQSNLINKFKYLGKVKTQAASQEQKEDLNLSNCDGAVKNGLIKVRYEHMREYQKIKKQIIENVSKQKQSWMKLNQCISDQGGHERKALGRCVKQDILKRQKQKNKQILEYYETTNPITKHLYDKYKKILNKNK